MTTIIKIISLLIPCLFVVEAKKPNVMIIFADDVGTGDVPGYWNDTSKVNMPNLENLVANGTTFTDAHSTPVCAPSRYVLLSGNYPHRGTFYGGMWTMNYREEASQFRRGQRSVANVFRDNGYDTAVFGKWHLGAKLPLKEGMEPPSTFQGKIDAGTTNALSYDSHDWEVGVDQGAKHLGFDTSYITSSGIQRAPYAFLRNDMFQEKDLNNITFWFKKHYQTPIGNSIIQKEGEGGPDWDSTAYNMILVNETETFLTNHVNTRPDDPFFAYVALGSVHTPHSPPYKYLDNSTVDGTYPTKHMDVLGEMDKVVGSLIQTLKDKDVLEDTIVLFASDNGGLNSKVGSNGEQTGHYSSGPLRGSKGQIWEGGHRIPMTFRWDNGNIPKGEKRSHLVGLNDVFATLCNLAGINVPPNQAMDSKSFASYMLNETKTDGLREYLGVWRMNGDKTYSSIRKGDMKLIYSHETKTIELYDLSNDLLETNETSNSNPELSKFMLEKLVQISPCYDQKGKIDVYKPWNNTTRRRSCNWFKQNKEKRCRKFHVGLTHCGFTCKGSRGCDLFKFD